MELIKPHYYHQNGTDVIDFIETMHGVQAAIEFCRGNVYKYTCRFQEKNGVEDLQKAKTYINRLMKLETKHKDYTGAKRTDSKRTFSNFIPVVNGVREVNGTKLYQTKYKCECGNEGVRYVEEVAESTTCHKCERELMLYPAAENEAHDEEFNYFTAY